MKDFKKPSILLSTILLAGIVAFSACKKDNTPTGTKAANEMCDCISKTKDTEITKCVLNWFSDHSKHVDVDIDAIINYDPESELEKLPVTFKNSKFEKDFYAGMAKCAASLIEDED